MLNLSDINLVVFVVSADPLDPNNSFLKIDRRYETIIVALDIEDDTVGSHVGWVKALRADTHAVRHYT
jgi:hypothetical protein